MNTFINTIHLPDDWSGNFTELLKETIGNNGLSGQHVFCHATHRLIRQLREEISLSQWEHVVKYVPVEGCVKGEMGRWDYIRFVAVKRTSLDNPELSFWIEKAERN